MYCIVQFKNQLGLPVWACNSIVGSLMTFKLSFSVTFMMLILDTHGRNAAAGRLAKNP